jgi:hypothetical protein
MAVAMANVINIPAVGALPENQQICLEILSNLTVDHLNVIKQRLGLGSPGLIGPMTVEAATTLFGNSFDLSQAGVTAFKAAQGLGDAGADHGVIGPQTAERYFQLLSISKGADVFAAAQRISPTVYESEGCAHAVSDAIIAAGYGDWLTKFLNTHNSNTLNPGSRFWAPNYAGIGTAITQVTDLQAGDLVIYNWEAPAIPSAPSAITSAKPKDGGGNGWDHIGIADGNGKAYNVSSDDGHQFVPVTIPVANFQIGYRI